MAQTLNPPPVVLHVVAKPLSRLFPLFRVCRKGVAAAPSPKSPVAPHPGPLVARNLALGNGGGVSLPLARGVAGSLELRNPVALRGWSSYTCERCATL